VNLQNARCNNKGTILLFHTISGPGADSASYLMGTAGFFLGVQQPRHLAGYSPSSSADVIVCSYTTSPQYAFMAYPGKALTLPSLNYCFEQQAVQFMNSSITTSYKN